MLSLLQERKSDHVMNGIQDTCLTTIYSYVLLFAEVNSKYMWSTPYRLVLFFPHHEYYIYNPRISRIMINVFLYERGRSIPDTLGEFLMITQLKTKATILFINDE